MVMVLPYAHFKFFFIKSKFTIKKMKAEQNTTVYTQGTGWKHMMW